MTKVFRSWTWLAGLLLLLGVSACTTGTPAGDVGSGDTGGAALEGRPAAGGAAGPTVTYVCTDGDAYDDCAGPKAIVGEVSSANFAFTKSLFPNPSVVLISVDNLLQGEPGRFVDEAGQILGRFTEPLFPGPGVFRVGLPFEPTGAGVDLDNDGAEDPGVQVYALRVGSNLYGDSYLQQLEQASDLGSFLTDVATGSITEGTFVVYAPDDAQAFPSAFGPDGTWFTDDDPAVTMPAGYTVVTLTADGMVTFDRSSEVAMNTVERPEQASLDFSDQGMLDSYNALIDALVERYAYTELRGLDWEEIRAEYLPRVEEAEANDDSVAFFSAVKDLALSIGDAHVGATASGNIDATVADAMAFGEAHAGNVGALTFLATADGDDGSTEAERLLVLTVGDGSPAADAGWVPGTEIVSVDGTPIGEHIDAETLFMSAGTAETRRLQQAGFALTFPLSRTVSIGYRLPGAAEAVTREMLTGAYATGPAVPETETSDTPISYEQRGDVAIVRWSDFMGYILPKIAVLEEALASEKERSSAGVVIDLRGNSGGWAGLYETMASYFFAEDDPMPVDVFDWWYYDTDAGDHVRAFAPDYETSSPNPEFAYTGPLVVLIDEHCASACEYFSQHLQLLDRATIIGQHASRGAGGFIDQVKLPRGIALSYTVGQTTVAGTEEPNLEAKGVVPDVRLPVTLETEQAKARGEDPVLEAALSHLAEAVAASAVSELPGTSWRFTMYLETGTTAETKVDTPGPYTIGFAEDGTVEIGADCNQLGGTYELDVESGSLAITPEEVALDACGLGSLGESFVRWLAGARLFDLNGTQLAIVTGEQVGVQLMVFEPAE